MFCGSIKKNIDPLEENDNESIIKVLKDTGLYDTILKLPEGIDTDMSNSQSVFS